MAEIGREIGLDIVLARLGVAVNDSEKGSDSPGPENSEGEKTMVETVEGKQV